MCICRPLQSFPNLQRAFAHLQHADICISLVIPACIAIAIAVADLSATRTSFSRLRDARFTTRYTVDVWHVD